MILLILSIKRGNTTIQYVIITILKDINIKLLIIVSRQIGPLGL